MGWFIGRVVDPGTNNTNRLVVFFVAVLTIFLAFQFFSRVMLSVGLGVGLGVAASVGFGVAASVMVGVAAGMAADAVLGMAQGVAFGVAFGVPAGVALGGVEFGVALGVALGVAFGAKFGVAGSVAFILGVLRVYFWLPELLWILTLFLLSGNGKRVNCLRYLPPRFDELIILPLPFMDVMIVEAYEKNPDVALETIYYLITSTNQQKVAAQAISGIAVDIVNRCQKLGDIVEIANQLAWIPSPPPKELGAVLPQFLDISQDVRASEEATSPYRKYELLNIPINALRQLAQSLALTTDAALLFLLATLHKTG